MSVGGQQTGYLDNICKIWMSAICLSCFGEYNSLVMDENILIVCSALDLKWDFLFQINL